MSARGPDLACETMDEIVRVAALAGVRPVAGQTAPELVRAIGERFATVERQRDAARRAASRWQGAYSAMRGRGR